MFNYLFLISAISLVSIDFIYLNLVKNLFDKQIRDVQGSPPQINYFGGALCYIFLIMGINYFIIRPNKSISDAFILGLIIYGVFETTNYALLKNWRLFTVIGDTLWGGVLFATTAFIVSLFRKL